MEGVYELARQVLRHLAEGIGAAMFKTLKTAKRAGGSGVVVAR